MESEDSRSRTISDCSTEKGSSGFCSSSSWGYRTEDSEQENVPKDLEVKTRPSEALETLYEGSSNNSTTSDAIVDIPTDQTENYARCQRLIDLVNITLYTLTQVNGQRIYGGPPPDWQGPPPIKGSEVFAGNLPRDCYEDELVPLFRKVGPIYEMRLMMQFSGLNRGYAFITYSNPEIARQAIEVLNNAEIRPSRRIGVVLSTNNCRVFVGHLSDVSADDIIKDICQLTNDVLEVYVYQAKYFRASREVNRIVFNPQFRTKYAMVEYLTHRAAAMAKRKLIPEASQKWGHNASIEWAVAKPFGKLGRIISGYYSQDSGLTINRIWENLQTPPKDYRQIGYRHRPAITRDAFDAGISENRNHQVPLLQNRGMIQNSQFPPWKRPPQRQISEIPFISNLNNTATIPLNRTDCPPQNVVMPPPWLTSVNPPYLPPDNSIPRMNRQSAVICPNVYKNLPPCFDCSNSNSYLTGMQNMLPTEPINPISVISSAQILPPVPVFLPERPQNQISPYITELFDN